MHTPFRQALPTIGQCLRKVAVAPATMLLLTVGSVFAFSACNGLFDGIYDSPPSGGTAPRYGFLHYDEATHRGQIFLDVGSYKDWTYVDLPSRTIATRAIPTQLTTAWDSVSAISYQHVTWPSTFRTDSIIPTDAMPHPEAWSLALHHYDVATHDGAALLTPFTRLDELPRQGSERDALLAQTFTPDSLTHHQAYYDLTGIFIYYIGYQHAAFNPVLSTWMDMDVKNPPPRYTLSQRVYLLRLRDGSVAALHFPSHVNAAGQKGYVTIDYIWPY